MNTKATQVCERMLSIGQKTAMCAASVLSWQNLCPKCSKIVNIYGFLLIRTEYKHIMNADHLKAKQYLKQK